MITGSVYKKFYWLSFILLMISSQNNVIFAMENQFYGEEEETVQQYLDRIRKNNTSDEQEATLLKLKDCLRCHFELKNQVQTKDDDCELEEKEQRSRDRIIRFLNRSNAPKELFSSAKWFLLSDEEVCEYVDRFLTFFNHADLTELIKKHSELEKLNTQAVDSNLYDFFRMILANYREDQCIGSNGQGISPFLKSIILILQFTEAPWRAYENDFKDLEQLLG